MPQLTLQQAYDLALGHHHAGRFAEAEALYRQILRHQPDAPEVLDRLGSLLEDSGRFADAVEVLERRVGIRPDADALVTLGNVYRGAGRLDEAIAAYRGAIELRPVYAGALNNLANALWDAGDLDAALPLLARSAETGTDPAAAGNLLFALHFHPAYGPAELFAQHARWDQVYARPLEPSDPAHANDPAPGRPLRIGYVSPDLRNHPVGLFMLPILANHDRGAFQVVCYSDAAPDLMTRRLATFAAGWRHTAGLSDAELAAQVRHDRIDVLIDLALHSRGSRLLAFARRPAPVQVTYLGYPSTTGLRAIDYRLSDPHLDPGGDDSNYSEKTIRLPETYWCYQPVLQVPPPGPLPALANGVVTFGCLNNFHKVTPGVLDAWQSILARVPGSRLVLHAHEGAHRRRLRDRFAAAGIDPARVEFVGAQPLTKYFETYQRIDVALDPFPFPGATTTLDALWSGVPVVSLAGRTAVSRGGQSILSNAGLARLVAPTPEQYVATAVDLAARIPELAHLRANLRGTLAASPLTNAPRFTRNLEAAFRAMWESWCRTRQNR